MKSSDACFAAADIIATRGHCKFTEEDPSGRVCLVGALNVALCGNAFRHRAEFGAGQQALTRVLAILGTARGLLALEHDVNGPVQWNNLPGTSGEDVILLLKRTGTALADAGD